MPLFVASGDENGTHIDLGPIQINREISHEHVTALREVMLEEKSIYLIFEYAEHDFLASHFNHESYSHDTDPSLHRRLLANHSPSLVDSNVDSPSSLEIIALAAIEWRRISSRQLDNSPRSQTREYFSYFQRTS